MLLFFMAFLVHDNYSSNSAIILINFFKKFSSNFFLKNKNSNLNAFPQVIFHLSTNILCRNDSSRAVEIQVLFDYYM